MPDATVPSARKRPVKVTLNAELLDQAKHYTGNLSATMESLLAEFVAGKRRAWALRQLDVDVCVEQWNAFHDRICSFSDEHTSLKRYLDF